MAKRRYVSVAILCLAVIVLAGVGVLVWTLLADDDDEPANVNALPTDQGRRGVWILNPETNEAEFIQFDSFVRQAKWVEDGETFVAEAGFTDLGLYNTDGDLLQTIVDLPSEIRPGVSFAVMYFAEPIHGTDDILLTRQSEQGFTSSRTWSLFNLETDEERPLPDFLRDAGFLVYSPDGSKVAYLQRNAFTWDLVVADADGEDVSIVASGPLDEVPMPEWSPDSTELLFRQGDRYRVIDVEGNDVWNLQSDRALVKWAGPDRLAVRRTFGPERPFSTEIVEIETGLSQHISSEETEGAQLQLSFSPDGTYVISQGRGESNEFIGYITDIVTNGAAGEPRPLPSEVALFASVDWTDDGSLALLSTP
jgi:hypothetical protein